MATGDINESLRPRYQTNQRFDVYDAQAESELRLVREQTLLKALLGSKTFIAGDGSTIGLVLQGGTLTGGVASAVTLDAPLFMGVDADGLLLIKSLVSGSMTLSVPSGTSTIYAYGTEVESSADFRAFLPANSPFLEYFDSTNTRFTLNVGLTAIAGDATVRETSISGVLKPLVALGVVSRSGTTVTVTKLFSNLLSRVPPTTTKVTPLAVSLAVVGTPGTTSYTYVVQGRSRQANTFKTSAPVTIATGPATLDDTNYINITFDRWSEAQEYALYRTASGGTPSTTGLISSVIRMFGEAPSATATFSDKGSAATGGSPVASTAGTLNIPASSTDHTSDVTSLTSLTQVALTALADTKWRGSLPGAQPSAQTAANNWGAFEPPKRGLDLVDRTTTGVWTIGDGITSFGEYDCSNYGGDFALTLSKVSNEIQLLSQVSTNYLHNRRTIIIKPGNYRMLSSATLTGNICIRAEQNSRMQDTLGTAPTLPRIGANIEMNNFSLTLSSGTVIENLIFWAYQYGVQSTIAHGSLVTKEYCKVKNCTFVQMPSTLAACVPVVTSFGTTTPGVQFEDCHFRVFQNLDVQATTVSLGLKITGARHKSHVKNCVFTTHAYTTPVVAPPRPLPTTMLHLDDPQGIRVTDCHFNMIVTPAMNGGGFFASQAALRVTVGAAINNSPYCRIEIRRCSFGLYNDTESNALYPIPYTTNGLAGTGYDYRGIQIEDQRHVSVQDCRFQNLSYGVVWLSTASSPGTVAVHHRNDTISNNSFVSMGIAGVAVFGSTTDTVEVDHRGLAVTNNKFYDCSFGVLIGSNPVLVSSSSKILLAGCTINQNTFGSFSPTGAGNQSGYGYVVGVGVCITAKAISNLTVDQNVFDSMVNCAVTIIPRDNTVFAWDGISVSNNRMTAIALNTAQFPLTPVGESYSIRNSLFGCISIGLNQVLAGDPGFTIRNVHVLDNLVHSFMTHAFTTLPTDYGSLEWFNGVIVRGFVVQNVDVSHNVFTSACTNLTNASLVARTHMVYVSAVSTPTKMANVNISHNQCGDSSSQMVLAAVTGVGDLVNIKIAHNMHHSALGSTKAPFQQVILISNSAWIYSADISYNKMVFEGNGTTYWVPHFNSGVGGLYLIQGVDAMGISATFNQVIWMNETNGFQNIAPKNGGWLSLSSITSTNWGRAYKNVGNASQQTHDGGGNTQVDWSGGAWVHVTSASWIEHNTAGNEGS